MPEHRTFPVRAGWTIILPMLVAGGTVTATFMAVMAFAAAT